MDEATFKQQLSKMLVRLREGSGLTRAAAAAAGGVPEDRLERYEKGLALPAVGELMNLARVFDVSLNHFFMSGPPLGRVEVVRASERWKVRPPTDTAAALNYSYEALSYRLTDKVMSPFHIEIPPSEGKEVEPLSHEGEEFHFILEGSVETTVGLETYRLSAGDAIYFDSRLRHSIRALGSLPARMLACLVNVRHPSRDDSPMQRQRGG
ncbi:MAG: cupin domain-containing protein [candidate division NC10 bacterium]|nr:cupin domain-containing protein [candidate division NC10 bacterium]